MDLCFLLVEKTLIRTSKVYYVLKQEDNVNSLHLIMPPFVFGRDLSLLTPYLEISAPNGEGQDMCHTKVSYDVEPYKEGYLSITVPVLGWMTKNEGTVSIRVIFCEDSLSEDEIVFKSTTSTFEVLDASSVEVIGYKPSGGGETHEEAIYTVIQDDITDTETAARSLHVDTFYDGDVLVIKDDYGVAAGYQYYNDLWVAFSGNVSSDNVIISQDILLAGSYEEVGNITKSKNETKTLPTKGTTLTNLITTVFTKEEQPTKTDPSMSLSYSQSGAKEVGTTINPSYSISYNEGSYTYDSTTGVTFSDLQVEDSDGHSSTSKSGSFPSFIVLDNTSYSITAQVKNSDGNIAKTNLGNPSNPPVKINAGTITRTSGNTTGYRPFFYGLLTHTHEPTSDDIRGLTNGGNYNSSKTFEIKVNGRTDIKRIVVAIPKSNTRGGISKVEKTDGLITDITATYVKKGTYIAVDDLRKTGTNMVDYVWWCYQPEKIDAAEVHRVTLK